MKAGTKFHIPHERAVPGPHHNFGKFWTAEQKELLRSMYMSNQGIAQMAKATGRDVGGVVRKLECMGLARDTHDSRMERLVPTGEHADDANDDDLSTHAGPYTNAQTNINPESEITMPITITTYTEVQLNGKDIKGKTNVELYQLIKREEDAVAALREIKNRPMRLTDEIARRERGISALVKHMDDVYKAERMQAEKDAGGAA